MYKIKKTLLLCLIFSLLSCGSTPTSATTSNSTNKDDIKPSSGITNTNLVLSNTTDYKIQNNMSSIGSQKLLVIPCTFLNEKEFTTTDLENINKAFFGKDLELEQGTNYYSLTDYYYQSSLGKLNITGEVTDILNVPYTVEEITNDGNYFPGVPAQYFYELETVTNEYLSSFDQNNDGYIDGVVFVYSSETTNKNSNFWAWVSNFEAEANLTRPMFNRHMWIGIDFFSRGNYDIDSHGIIHEMGHLLGLRDYYPSDNYNIALGGHSMMDYNISDHDPYSKMLLNWADPIYYDFSTYNEVSFNLNSFEETNEFILFNLNWNHSVMDEYLLIEFYTPSNLNYLDSINKYTDRPLGFSKPGIKIYHIDSRISKAVYDTSLYSLVFDSYVDEIPSSYDPSNTYYLIGANNTNEYSYTDATRKGRYKQIAMIENKEFNKLQAGEFADDDSLFYKGDIFDSSNSAYLLNGKFNNGNLVNLKLKVNEITSNYANITISLLEE